MAHHPDPNETQFLAMLEQARSHFGSAVKSVHFHDALECPGCGAEVDEMQVKGKSALSLNFFIYRKRGVLIGYLLCSNCAGRIFHAARKNPYRQIPLHDMIERCLIESYETRQKQLDDGRSGLHL